MGGCRDLRLARLVDEVCLIQGPGALGFQNQTEAHVSSRASLAPGLQVHQEGTVLLWGLKHVNGPTLGYVL